MPHPELSELADQRSLGRLLTRLERDPGYARSLLASLPVPVTPTHRIGVTGSPGVGKSTLLGRLQRELRDRGERIGIIAVDPSSPLSGGALLGDRLRLAPPQDDPDLFIRSLASRGSLGGVTPAASAVAAVLEVAGYSTVLIETVGVGQTGYDVVCLADTVLALFSPESGDAMQLMKAGILEIGDVLAVNKCDRPGADALLAELKLSVELDRQAAAGEDDWKPPVLALRAAEGLGLSELLSALDAHRAWLAGLPATHPRRARRVARELTFVVRSHFDRLLEHELAALRDQLARQVLAAEINMATAVETLLTASLSQSA